MSYFPDGGLLPWHHTPALVPDHYGNDGRVAEATALDTAERRARATMILTDVVPSKLSTRVVVPRTIRRDQGA